jgi:hypothetical protein
LFQYERWLCCRKCKEMVDEEEMAAAAAASAAGEEYMNQGEPRAATAEE